MTKTTYRAGRAPVWVLLPALATGCTDLRDGAEPENRRDAAVAAADASAGADHDATLDDRPIDSVPAEDAGKGDARVVVQGSDAVFELGAACDDNGDLGCAGYDQALVLLCKDGEWTQLTVCDGSQRCDSRVGSTQGQCLEIVDDCRSRAPDDQFCAGDQRLACGADRVTAVDTPCPDGEGCVLEAGAAKCEPRAPECSSQAGECAPVDPCAAGNGGCDTSPLASCHVTGDGVRSCMCPVGYAGSGEGDEGCAEVDECAPGPRAACGEGADGCENNAGSYVCACARGFSDSDPTHCVDIDECAQGAVAACGDGATACENRTGSYACACAGGYSGTGGTACSDVDECAGGAVAACGAGATGCQNTAGSYACVCAIGQSGTGGTACGGVDECAAGVVEACGLGATSCDDLVSGHRCACARGYWGSGTTRCTVNVNEGFDGLLAPELWSWSFTPGAASVEVDTASGTLDMQTIPNTACATAELHGLVQATVASGDTLVFDSHVLRTYVDQGVYGDAQPRGLAAGTDRRNAIEFITVQPVPNMVACRTVRDGVATETKVDIGASVNSPLRYKIVARAQSVVFYVNDALVATHTQNIPLVPLNVYYGTGDSCQGNVPVAVDWVSYTSWPSGRCQPASGGPFTEHFTAQTLGAGWSQFTYGGTRHNNQMSPANHLSLTDSPGALRYILDPMTLPAQSIDYVPYFADPFYWYDPGHEVSRDLGGDHWVLESRADWYVPNVVNSAEFHQAVHLGPPGSTGMHCQLVRFSNDDVGAGSSRTNNILSAGCSVGKTTLATWVEWAGLDTTIRRFVRFARAGDVMTIALSTDGTIWNEVVATQIPEAYRCDVPQRFAITGAAWFRPSSAFADYEYVRFTREH